MNACILEMLYFDRANVSEETGVNKARTSKECCFCQ